jgi:hypothetical protein
MGGNGSSYSRRDIKDLKEAFENELNADPQNGAGDGGVGLFSIPEGQDHASFTCPNGTEVTLNPAEGDIIFTKNGITAEISFETYEREYSEEYGSDYCDAAEAILEDYGE